MQSDESRDFLSYPQLGGGKLREIVDNSEGTQEKEGAFRDAKIKLLTVSKVLPVDNSAFLKIKILHFADLTKENRKKGR